MKRKVAGGESREHGATVEPAGTSPAARDAAGDFALREELRKLVRRSDFGPGALEFELHDLEQVHASSVYSELLHLLTHMHVDQQDAKQHWQSIVDHRLSMQERLGSAVDLRVALLDYFVAIRPRLKNPKIVEMNVFDRAQAAVYRDELTGLYNYRFFNEQLAREIFRGERGNSPVSLVVIDVDDFKAYNDRWGHEAGNRMLATLGSLLVESLRREDIAARFGGEEFAVILPGTPKTGARIAVEGFSDRIERHDFGALSDGSTDQTTISAGVATFPADADNAVELLRRADSAMYAAKAGGKNRVELFAESSRSFRRVGASIEGRFRIVAEQSHPLETVQIGGGGMLFVSERSLAPGSLVEIDLRLPPGDREVAVPARVTEVEPREAGGFEIAVTMEGLGSQDRYAFGRFVREVDGR